MRLIILIGLLGLTAACSQSLNTTTARGHSSFDAPIDCNNIHKRGHPDYHYACNRGSNRG
jgi:hypothetical protein